MKVCHVCSGHPVDDFRVYHREALALAKAGYDVHVIGSGAETGERVENGVTLHSVVGAPSRSRRMQRRNQIAAMAASINPCLFHVHEPELLGPTIRVARGRPVIWDVHESYLDVLMDREWIPKLLRPIARLLWDINERTLVRKCAAVVVSSVWIAPRYTVMHLRTRVVCNYPDVDWADTDAIPGRDGCTCVYAGSIDYNRGVLETLSALAILMKRGVTVRFELVGRGAPEFFADFWREADRLGVRSLVHYHGVVTRAEAADIVNRSSIGLVPHLPGRASNCVAVPVKLLDYMGASLPMVYGNLPNHIELLDGAVAGIAVNPLDPVDTANAIETLITHPDDARKMGEAGRLRVEQTLNWAGQAEKLVSLYREILT